MYRGIISLFLLFNFAFSAQGYTFSSWYNCPGSCVEPNCHCASTTSPLPIEETPQFILVTNDDTVDANVTSWMSKMVDDLHQPNNNCPVPVTWFTLVAGSDCQYIQPRWERGDEIACHSLTHIPLYPNVTKDAMLKEIISSKEYVEKVCQIPNNTVNGYRAPYLVINPQFREILYQNGFEYESSMVFDWATGEPNPAGNRTWPFTMDYGIPDNDCSTPDYQFCLQNESYPGFWEVPLWEIRSPDGQSYTMDPGAASVGNGQARPVDQVMQYFFDQSYSGNRAPIPFYVHIGWYNDTRVSQARTFFNYAMSHPNVYFVTMSQLVDWMKNPVPNSQMDAWMAQQCVTRSLYGPPTPTPGPLSPSSSAPPSSPLSFMDTDKGPRMAMIGRKRLARYS